MANNFRSPLLIDSDTQYVGNSPGTDGRGRVHVKISNADGESIPVHITGNTTISDKSIFAQVSAVPSGTETLVLQYLVPLNTTYLLGRVDCSGENVAVFNVYLDGVQIGIARTWWTQFQTVVDFAHCQNGQLEINAGSLVEVKVIHQRPSSANFEARLQGQVK